MVRQKQKIYSDPAPMDVQFIHPEAVTRATETAFKPGIKYTFNVTLNTSTESIRIEIGGEIGNWN